MMMLVVKKGSVVMVNLLTKVMIQCMLSLMNLRCFVGNNNWIPALLWLSFCLGTPRAVHNQRYKWVAIVPPKYVTLSRLMANIGSNVLFEAYCSLCLCGHLPECVRWWPTSPTWCREDNFILKQDNIPDFKLWEYSVTCKIVLGY